MPKSATFSFLQAIPAALYPCIYSSHPRVPHMQKCLLVSVPASDGPNEQSKLETWEDSSNRQVWESLKRKYDDNEREMNLVPRHITFAG